jgi:xylulokinase
MNDIIQAELAAGIKINGIRLTGGAAKSSLWCQMMADIYKQPIHILQTSETGCLGAALYAGVGVGAYKNCHEAASVVRIENTYEPNPANYAAYDEAYARFGAAYDALDGKVF